MLEELVEQTGWEFFAWVLMSNHYHLVFKTPEPNLVAGMKWLQNTWEILTDPKMARSPRRRSVPFLVWFCAGFLVVLGSLSAELAEKQKFFVAKTLAETKSIATTVKVTPDNYASHPYWEAVFALGEAVSDAELKTLDSRERLSLEEHVACMAATCARKKERLQNLVQFYTMLVSAARGRVFQSPEIQKAHATPADRYLWEAILQSPVIMRQGGLGPRRCVDALEIIADPRSIEMLMLARSRLLGKEGRERYSANASPMVLKDVGDDAVANLVAPIARLDAGGATAAKALLDLHLEVEKKYPLLASFEQFREKKEQFFYQDQDSLGVNEYIREVVFRERDAKGGWLWEQSLRKILPTLEDESQKAVVNQLLQRIDAN